MTCTVRPACSGCTFCEAREAAAPGLHVAALEYTEHEGPGSRIRLEIAALRAAIAVLEASGEAGTTSAILLLEQTCDELADPPIPELKDPEATPASGVPQLYAGGLVIVTRPYFGRRPR